MTRSPSAPSGGWLASVLVRHAIALLVSLVLVLLLGPGLGRDFPARTWNQVLGRASLVLVGVTLVVGPLARLVPRLAGLLRVRRELGAWSALLAIAHVGFVFEEWAGWSLSPLWTRFDGSTFSADGGLALANLAGTIALGYALVLLATSNDVAQRSLGARWKHIQRGATTLFALAVIHTAFFIYLDTYPGRGFRGLGGPYLGFTWVLIGLVLVVAAIRTIAFWIPRRRTGSSEDDV